MKVRVLPLQPHCFAFGGFELQMIGAIEAAKSIGLDIAPLDPWSRDSDFEILQLWGLDVANLQSAYWAKEAGKKVVLSALLPYDSLRSRLGRVKAFATGKSMAQRQLRSYVTRLVVVNEAQRDSAIKLYGYSPQNVDVIPNVVDSRYIRSAAQLRNGGEGDAGYVLCPGNVCRRKNQLSLVRACKIAGIPLILVGKTLTGEEAYGEIVEREMQGESGIKWIPGLMPGSLELVQLYAKAKIIALVSHQETQPICMLEGAAMGKTLLMSDRAFARQRTYTGAVLVNPGSIASIIHGLRTALNGSGGNESASYVAQECTSKAVGYAYQTTYHSAMRS